MLLVTDLHLREESAEVVLGEILPGIAQGALAAGETEIGCLGDVWHLRYRAAVRLMTAMRDELERQRALGLKWSFIAGNHDQIDVHGRNILEFFDSVATIHKERFNWTPRGVWIPYHHDQKAFAETFAEAAKRAGPHKSGPPVAFIHQGVRGAWMNDSMPNKDGIDPAMFKGWRVFSGHYHKRQIVGLPGEGQVEFLGTAWQTRADEANQAKGYALWDGKQVRYVDTAWGPRHYKFTGVADASAIPLSQLRPQDVVSVTTAPGVSAEKIGKKLAAAGVLNHTVTPQVEHKEARLSVRDNATMQDYAKAYIDLHADPSHNKEVLFNIFQKLVG